MEDLITRITIDDYVREDIAIFVDYWHDTSSDHIREMGVDQVQLPSRSAMAEALDAALDRRRLAERRAALRVVAIRANDRTIGFHQVTDFVPGRKSAIMHGYITDPSWRGRGAGTVSYTKSMVLFFDRFDLASILFETPFNNPAAHAIKRKLGIRSVGRTVIDKPFLLRPLPATVYEVERAEFEGIVANMYRVCAGVSQDAGACRMGDDHMPALRGT